MPVLVWPTHPAGSNKRIGDMTTAERTAVMADARKRYFDCEPVEDDPEEYQMRDNWSGYWRGRRYRGED